MIRYYTAAEVAHIWRRPIGTVHRYASADGWRKVEDRKRPALYNADDVEKTMNGNTVWAVTFSNYEPAEIVALYDNPTAAEAHAEALGEGWRAVRWTVGSTYTPTDAA